MMTKDEALKMAIAEIEGWIDHAYGHTPEECADNKAIQACKEALEQPIIRDWKETIDERIAKDDEFKKALEQPAQEQILKSLRDEFAMAALQGMISTAGAPCLGGLDGFEKHAAKAAYKMADAMIKTRELKDE